MATQGFPVFLSKDIAGPSSASGGIESMVTFQGKKYVTHRFVASENATASTTRFGNSFEVFDFIVKSSKIFAHVLIVGGGGGGGYAGGSGGGGAGGVLLNGKTWDADIDLTKNEKLVIEKGSYKIGVGARGAQGFGANDRGYSGGPSFAFGFYAIGGGGGGGGSSLSPLFGSASDGGSGGGAGDPTGASFGIALAVPNLQGFNGSPRTSSTVGGAGGGAGGAGSGTTPGKGIEFMGETFAGGGGIGASAPDNTHNPGFGGRGGISALSSVGESGNGIVVIAYEAQ